MKRILIVEKEKEVIRTAQKSLAHAGFEMFSAYDGRHGLQMAKNIIPNLIITDNMIPEMNSFEMCQAIKFDEDTKDIPIIVLSEEEYSNENLKTLGIHNFISKPLSLNELDKAVKDILGMSKTLQDLKSSILIGGRPEVLTCCQELLKDTPYWTGYYYNNNVSLLHDAIEYVPDVILIDLLMSDIMTDQLILKIKENPELKRTSILTYYSSEYLNDSYGHQVEKIEIQYMKIISKVVGAKECLGAFNPVTFLNLINPYRRNFNFII